MKLNRILTAAVVLVFAAAAIVAVTKWRSGTQSARQASPSHGAALLVVGVEGFEPSIADRLISEGRLPNLSRVLKDGSALEFPSLERGVDRRISWTSLVTGVSPERQGIGGTVESPRGGTMPARLVPASRTVDTIWTLLSKRGDAVAVLGWPGTWPVEQVNGLMVVPYDTFILERAHGGRMADVVWPPESAASVDTLFRVGADVRRRELARFVNEKSALGIEALIGENDSVLSEAVAEGSTMLALARYAVLDPGAQGVFVYLRGLDSVSQRFWHYAHPELFADTPMPPETRKAFEEHSQAVGVTIDRYYEYFDELLGDFLSLVSPGGTVAIVADHGYSGIRFDQSGNPMIGVNMHSGRGFLALAGPSVAGGRRESASLLDVAPTIMSAAGIRIPPEAEGKAVSSLLRS